MNGSSIIAVFIGGGLGSLLRYLISLLIIRSSSAHFPWATLIANGLSCILMAAFLIYAQERFQSDSWQRLFVLVGICGGFSTFSTFSLENFMLLKQGAIGILIFNIILSVILCLSVFFLFNKSLRLS